MPILQTHSPQSQLAIRDLILGLQLVNFKLLQPVPMTYGSEPDTTQQPDYFVKLCFLINLLPQITLTAGIIFSTRFLQPSFKSRNGSDPCLDLMEFLINLQWENLDSVTFPLLHSSKCDINKCKETTAAELGKTTVLLIPTVDCSQPVPVKFEPNQLPF
jgi:hypothetical protein